MKINKPNELIGKEVHDLNGNTIGIIDKWWNSWNMEYPGYFFGIRPTENTKDAWFRGTTKLIPVYSDYVKEYGEYITLNKTVDQLSKFWNKIIPCGATTCPTDQLVDMPIFDKDHSRVGTFYGWIESDGAYKHYGCFVDPYLCETWKLPFNTLMPMPIDSINNVSDTITLYKSLQELKDYWQQYYKF